MSEIEVVEFGEPWERTLLETACEIANTLEKHYPGHRWEVSFQGGALVVRHPGITNMLSSMNIKGACWLVPKGVTKREAVRAAIEAGGSILEMFSLPRGKLDGREPVIPSDVRSYFK